MRYGATPKEWDHFDLNLKLTQDLLPVVSNPNATISERSKIRKIGKTPSIYNRGGNVAGIKDWTMIKATDKEINQWRSIPDYGMCLQTREVRALDIDVDSQLAIDIRDHALEFLFDIINDKAPVRARQNSKKCLVAFKVQGDLAKRILPVEGGIVEFLATGQQFVAAGCHDSGARYEWNKGKLPESIPEIPLEEFEKLWTQLVEKFGVGEVVHSNSIRQRKDDLGIYDPFLETLEVLDWGKDGQAFITCPFEYQHTSDTGISATAYFPRGTRGYEQGHFVCKHAHCAGRNDGEFIEALGLYEKEIEYMPPIVQMPRLKRNKVGEILPTVDNVQTVLLMPEIIGEEIRFDTFRDEIMVAPRNSEGQWRVFEDDDYTRLRVELERLNFKTVGRELIRDVVHRVAKMKKFDSAIDWLNSLKWDGVPRVKNFFKDYFEAEDSDYGRAVSRYLWTGLAGRVLKPGIKADMVPVLIGKQGVGKSWGVSEIAVSPDHFNVISLAEKDTDLIRRMRGKLVLEISELRGLHSRDMESNKEFITRTHESWVPKYQEFANNYARRCLFLATTNQEEFLGDSTGNRRWLPIRIGTVQVQNIIKDRLQLWAEARVMFEMIGVDWQEAQELGKDVHDNHRLTDTWQEVVSRWYFAKDEIDGTIPAEKEFILIEDVVRFALGMDIRNVKRGDEMRLAAILRELGLKAKRLRKDNKQIRVWMKHSI